MPNSPTPQASIHSAAPHLAPFLTGRWLLALVAFVFVLPQLLVSQHLPPLDRDESRFAQATTQMLESGDFLTIRFQDQERNKKPAGIYWLQAASVKAFSSASDRAILAYRLPSIISAIVLVLIVMQLGNRLFDRSTGFLAAGFMATAPSLIGEATIAKTDASLVMFVCLMQWALAAILVRDHRASDAVPATVTWRWPILFWGAMGASVLIKGPIGPMVGFLTIIAFVTGKRFFIGKERPSPSLMVRLKPVTGLVIILVMVLPWLLAINTATDGRFLREALGGDMLGKVGQSQESHAGPPGFHLFLLPLLFWPISPYLFRMLRQLPSTIKSERILFLAAWLVPCWMIFELTATKLPHYTLTLYPSLALIIAAMMRRIDFTGSASLLTHRLGLITFAIVGLVLSITMVVLSVLYTSQSLPHLGFIISLVTGLIVLAASTYFVVRHWRTTELPAPTFPIAVSAITLVCALTIILPSLDRLYTSPRLSDRLAALDRHPLRTRTTPPFSVSLSGYYEPSAVFLLGTDARLTSNLDEIAMALKSEQNHTAIIEERLKEDFLEAIDNAGLSVAILDQVSGFNYSKGDDIRLLLFAKTNDNTPGKIP